MKRILIFTLFAFILSSCTNSYYKKVDRALDECELYEHILLDSLERLKSANSWENALKLADAYSHYQLDSCLKYSLKLRSLYGGDKERVIIGESQIAQIHRRRGENDLAKKTFDIIDTSGVDLSGETGLIYYYSGYFVYGGLVSLNIETLDPKARMMAQELKKYGDSSINSIFALHQQNISDGNFEEDLAMLLAFVSKDGISLNEKCRGYNYLSQTYNKIGNENKSIEYTVESTIIDIVLSVKNYNSLFRLGIICYENGDINHARRYIMKSLEDARFCNQPNFINRSLKVNNILNEALLQSARIKTTILSIGVTVFAFFIVFLLFMFHKERHISLKLKIAKDKITDLSNIKDTFISSYIEQCSKYINKVDQDRSRLRQIAKNEGVDQLLKELRSPSFSNKEFSLFLKGFDKDFLYLFPNFVQTLNSVMKEGKKIKQPKDGSLSTEIRILALIRLGIDNRAQISKILNTSLGTIYTYHSVLLNNSTLPANEFDDYVRTIM